MPRHMRGIVWQEPPVNETLAAGQNSTMMYHDTNLNNVNVAAVSA